MSDTIDAVDIVDGVVKRNEKQVNCPFQQHVMMKSSMGYPIRVFSPCHVECAHFHQHDRTDSDASSHIASLTCGGQLRRLQVISVTNPRSDEVARGAS